MIPARLIRSLILVAAAAAAPVGAGCIPGGDVGEWGVVRYFAELPGRTPMRMIPPINDRDGNIYVLHGNHTRPEPIAYVGRAAGNWVRSCDFLKGRVHKGDDRGVHGWVGFAQNRAWYWSGDALVETSGRGDCRMILDQDPVSRANLFFRGVYPWVKDQPSRIRVPALVAGPGDEAPFHAVVELDVNQYGSVVEFQPPFARQVKVAGVGANPGRKELYTLVSFEVGGQRVVEGRVSTYDGELLKRTVIDGLDDLPMDAVLGYLEAPRGYVAGLLEDGRVIVYDGGWSRVYGPDELHGMVPAGVHAHGNKLWLVGVLDDAPHIAEILPAGIEEPILWEASLLAEASLRAGHVPVRDEREQPYVFIEWASPRSAIGAFPLLSPFSPQKYGKGMTGWILAGPAFENLVEGMTAVAFAPIGLSYP